MKTTRASSYGEILRLVGGVRRRWRAGRVLRGAVIVGAVAGLALALSAWGITASRFSESSVLIFRILSWAIIGGLTLWLMVWPLLRKVTDERVALYLAENEPDVEGAVLTALEAGAPSSAAAAGDSASEADSSLVDGLIDSAVRRAKAVEFGRRIDRTAIRRAGGALAGVAILLAGLYAISPLSLRQGALAVLTPTRAAAELNPFSIDVQPGDTTIVRGADASIRANLVGFESADAELFVRYESDTEARPLSMIPADSGGFEAMLLGLGEEAEYFVRSSGVQSESFRIAVADLPFVDQLQLEYRFPAYTGLPPRIVEDGGDVAALRGTRVILRATSTIPTPGGVVVVDGTESDLTVAETGQLLGEFTVGEPGFYWIELLRDSGERVESSPHFTIDVLADLPPSVSFRTPGRDTRASSIEEVYVEAHAEDDYGIRTLDLVYSVNGQDEDTLSLVSGGAAGREVTAGHTFFLEELGLETGDFVSYYAVARDGNRIDGASPAISDMYFVQVRPFRREFRQAEQGPPGGGGGGGGPQTALSLLQRQIISATFNLNRDRESYETGEFSENAVTITLSQERLREQVERLHQQMVSRGIADSDPGFGIIAEALPKAMEAMDRALEILRETRVRDALSPEQEALKHLQRAEDAFEEIQIAQGQQGQGGGGQSTAEDLADLFELELDKLKNQYETVQRGQEEQAQQQVDEALEKLRQLARRQEQQAERRRREAAQQQAGGGGGGGEQQRDLAEETEEAARQLERLARERRSPELDRVAEQMREAAEAMRQSATQSGAGGAADAGRALERLDQARRRLERAQSDRLSADTESALDRARQLRAEQERVQRDAESVGPGTEDAETRRRLQERKTAMADEAESLEQSLDRLAADFRREDRDAAERLSEAAGGIRRDRLKERIRYSSGLLGIDTAQSRLQEEQIRTDLESLEERLERALAATGEGSEDRSQEALDRAGELRADAESLGRRLDPNRNRGQQQGERGEQGQQPGQQGQPGGQPQPGGQAGGEGFAPGAQSGRPGGGRLSPDEARQFRRELGERRADAEALREILEEAGVDASDLDAVIAAMRALDRQRVYNDPDEVARLHEAIVEGLREVEFSLRREILGREPRIFLSGSDEVPEGYREL
ncbi:MAG: DUF4175 family protein, partial [Gemmatimonadota bacterium]